MTDLKKCKKVNQTYFQVAGVLLLLLLAAFLLWLNNSNSMQAMPAMVGDVYFEGEYRIALFPDHINLTFCEDGCPPVSLDTENPL
ncbi:MAG: hypothetical protein E7629_01970 [Ruminococcaceae bacterium]|nr:hypothetical protein [Oscillospiraceae bacterium]